MANVVTQGEFTKFKRETAAELKRARIENSDLARRMAKLEKLVLSLGGDLEAMDKEIGELKGESS